MYEDLSFDTLPELLAEAFGMVELMVDVNYWKGRIGSFPLNLNHTYKSKSILFKDLYKSKVVIDGFYVSSENPVQALIFSTDSLSNAVLQEVEDITVKFFETVNENNSAQEQFKDQIISMLKLLEIIQDILIREQ